MRKLFAIVGVFVAILIIKSPQDIALAATNYGEGSYGGGVYNVGETPIPLTDASPAECIDTIPTGSSPWLYSVYSNSNSSITLNFTNWQNPVDRLSLEYGTESNKYSYGIGNIGNKDVQSFTVNSLDQNTVYYFKIRTWNGCALGAESNELTAKTLNTFTTNNLNFLNTFLEAGAPSTSGGGYMVNIKLRDATGHPIIGADVTMHSTPQTQKTDINGIATFSDVEPGDHKIDISYNNYQGEQSVNLTGNVQEFNINVTIEQKKKSLGSNILAIAGFLTVIIVIAVFYRMGLKKRACDDLRNF